MFDQEYRPASAKSATEVRREASEEARLSGAALPDDDLDGVAGGIAHIGEEIPQ
jgi:hypothetical protein